MWSTKVFLMGLIALLSGVCILSLSYGDTLFDMLRGDDSSSLSPPAEVDVEDVQGRMRIVETLTTFHHRVSILEVDGKEYLLNSNGGIILLE